MTQLADRVVQEAREWIGTPYMHQVSVKGVGSDCLGLLRGVWRHLYGAEPEAIPHYTSDWSEPQGDEALWRAALRHLVAKDLDDAGNGDVLLFRMRHGGVAKHLGLQSVTSPSPRFIHAFGNHAVLESPLSAPWRRRIVARFRFPNEV